MSFLDFQSESPEFLNNYLKYVRFISFNAETTVNEAYFDLRTLLRFIKLMLYDESKLNNFDPDYFKTISIKDITLATINTLFITKTTPTIFLPQVFYQCILLYQFD